jgi:hypothetical protein
VSGQPLEVRVSASKTSISSLTSSSVPESFVESRRDTIRPPPEKRRQDGHACLNMKETDETRPLSNQDLHRLVMLEQLELIRAKKRRLEQNNKGEPTVTSYKVLSSQEIVEFHASGN